MIEMTTGSARVAVSPEHGGRVGSLVVHGAERLVTGPETGFDPLRWGSYPMVPWAGRVRHGRFTFDGRTWEVPVNLPPHAIHGTCFDRPWRVVAASDAEVELAVDLGNRWPFGGTAVQRIALDGNSLTCTLEVHAAERPMPVCVGWHPWFRRPVELAIEPGSMWERGPDATPTGRLVPPSARPWDDCVVDLARDPALTWPDGVSLTVSSSCTHWVVFDVPEDAICVEPQSGPPDAFNLVTPDLATPGAPLTAWMRWTWRRVDR